MKSLFQEVVPVYVPNHIFAQMCLPKCKDTYFILLNKYLRIYEDSFGAKILRDDCVLYIMYNAFI